MCVFGPYLEVSYWLRRDPANSLDTFLFTFPWKISSCSWSASYLWQTENSSDVCFATQETKTTFLTRWKSSSKWATDIFVFQFTFLSFILYDPVFFFRLVVHVHHCHVKVCVWQFNFSLLRHLFFCLIITNKNNPSGNQRFIFVHNKHIF